MRNSLLALCVCAAWLTSAADIFYNNDSGLYYEVLEGDSTVSVTFDQIESKQSYEWLGDMVVPEWVTNRETGKTYHVVEIGDEVFVGSPVRSLTFPPSLKRIGKGAFGGCVELIDLELPATLEFVDDGAFTNCGLKHVKLPDIDLKMGDGVFSGCAIDYIDLGGLTSIPDYTFGACRFLKSISISDDVEYIGDYAFAGSGLTSITFGPNIKYIGAHAFDGASGLTSITFTTCSPTIGDGAFAKCGNSGFYVDNSNPVLSAVRGVLYNKDHTRLIAYPYANNASTYAVLPTTTEIAPMAFYGKNIDKVEISKGLRSIGRLAFATSHIKAVNIPEGTVSLGDSIFYNCTYLSDLTFEKGPEVIPAGMFMMCYGFKSLTIPEGVKELGYGAISSCQGLEKIILPQSLERIGERAVAYNKWLVECNLPDAVTTIGKYAFNESMISIDSLPANLTTLGERAFANCRKITSIKMNDKLTWAGEAVFTGTYLTHVKYSRSLTKVPERMFSSCPLQEIELPEGVDSIGKNAFYGCGLTKIVLPSTMQHIGSMAFNNCGKIAEVTCYAMTPPETDGDVFEGANRFEAKLTVPQASVADYKAHPVWKKFSKINVTQPKRADLNGDNTVDVRDINMILNYILGVSSLPDLQAADLNEDFDIDIADVSQLVNAVLSSVE